VEFRVTTGQPQGVAGGQGFVGQRREELELGTERLEGVEVGRVDEAVGGVAGDDDLPAGEQGRNRRRRHRRELDRRRQFRSARLLQMIGQAVESLIEVHRIHFTNDLQISYCNGRLAEILHSTAGHLNGLDLHSLGDDAILAMLRHYREDRDFMYGLDIQFLDEAREAKKARAHG